VVIDAFSRRVAGSSVATHLSPDLVLNALEMALSQPRPEGVVHHSDQGCQYTSIALGQSGRQAGVRPSIGPVGDCYGNALCESFFATRECELLDRCRFRTQVDARMGVFDYIEGWYNPHRRQSSVNQVSPAEFERSRLFLPKTESLYLSTKPGIFIYRGGQVMDPRVQSLSKWVEEAKRYFYDGYT
jgi:putative transposase